MRQDIGVDPSQAKPHTDKNRFDVYKREDFDRNMQEKGSFEPSNYYY